MINVSNLKKWSWALEKGPSEPLMGFQSRQSLFDIRLDELRSTGQLKKTGAIPSQMINESISDSKNTFSEFPELPPTKVEDTNELEVIALKDSQSDLYNSRAIMDALKREILRAERYKQSVGVLILKINDFEFLCKSLSLLALETTIKAIAKIIYQNIRGVDMAGRLEEDKVLVFLPETNAYQTQFIAERLKNLLTNSHISYIGESISVSVSAGSAEYPHNGVSALEVIGAAQQALSYASTENINFAPSLSGNSEFAFFK